MAEYNKDHSSGANVGNAQTFKNRRLARPDAATDSSGGTNRLGRITRRGDKYLRMLLVYGGRSRLRFVDRKTDPKNGWARRLAERRM